MTGSKSFRAALRRVLARDGSPTHLLHLITRLRPQLQERIRLLEERLAASRESWRNSEPTWTGESIGSSQSPVDDLDARQRASAYRKLAGALLLSELPLGWYFTASLLGGLLTAAVMVVAAALGKTLALALADRDAPRSSGRRLERILGLVVVPLGLVCVAAWFVGRAFAQLEWVAKAGLTGLSALIVVAAGLAWALALHYRGRNRPGDDYHSARHALALYKSELAQLDEIKEELKGPGDGEPSSTGSRSVLGIIAFLFLSVMAAASNASASRLLIALDASGSPVPSEYHRVVETLTHALSDVAIGGSISHVALCQWSDCESIWASPAVSVQIPDRPLLPPLPRNELGLRVVAEQQTRVLKERELALASRWQTAVNQALEPVRTALRLFDPTAEAPCTCLDGIVCRAALEARETLTLIVTDGVAWPCATPAGPCPTLSRGAAPAPIVVLIPTEQQTNCEFPVQIEALRARGLRVVPAFQIDPDGRLLVQILTEEAGHREGGVSHVYAR